MPPETAQDTSHLNKNTMLHLLAGNYRYQDLVSHFDVHKNHLETQNEAGDTPLLYAAKKGAADAVAFLINKGADFTCKDKNNFSLAHALAQSGDEKNFLLLLKKSKITYKNRRRHNSLINALTSDTWAPINGDERFQCRKWSPIQFALHFNHQKMARFLKILGAKLPNEYVKQIKQLDANNNGIKSTPDAKGLWHAAKSRNLRLLEKLIDQGAPFLQCDSKGNTILHDALLSANPMPRLTLISALPASGVPKKGLIYVSEDNGKLHYTLQTRLGCIVKESLPIVLDDNEALTHDKLDELTLQILMHIPLQYCFSTDEKYCSDLALLLLKKYEERRKIYHNDKEGQSWLEKQWGALFESGQDHATIFNVNHNKKTIIEIALEKGYSRFAYQCVSHLKQNCQSDQESPSPFVLEYRSMYSGVREQISKIMDKALTQKDGYLLAHCINADFESLILRESPHEPPIHKAFDTERDEAVEKMVIAWHKTLNFESEKQTDEMLDKLINYLHESKNGYGETLAVRRAEFKLNESLEGVAKICHQTKYVTKQILNHVRWQQDYNTNHLRKTYSYKTISFAKSAITVLPNLASEGLTRFGMNFAMNVSGPWVLNAINSSNSQDESWLRWTARNGAYSAAYFALYGTNLNAHLAASACGYLGGTLAHYALPEHLELQGGLLALSEVMGTYAAWQGPLEPKIPSFYFERMRHEEWPEFIPATLEAFNSLDYYAKQVLSVPENPIYYTVQGLNNGTQAAFDALGEIPWVAPVVRGGQWLKKSANQAREQCLDQLELALLDYVMPATYMNSERKAFIAQSEANRLESHLEELKQLEAQHAEQGTHDESLGNKIEEATDLSKSAQELADSLYAETPTYKAFAQFQEDFNDYQQAQIDHEVARRTNSTDPQAQAQAIKETEEKQNDAYERMVKSREALGIYASEEALEKVDEETKKIDQETKEGIQNILDDSCLAPWIDNLIAKACLESSDKQDIAKYIADELINHLFPFGGDAAEMQAKHQEIVDKIVTDDMKGWERTGSKAETAQERAKDNMYQTILAKVTGGEIQTRHEKSRWDRVGTYIYGGVFLAASAVTFFCGLPTLSTAMLANGIRCLQNKKGEGETIPIFNVNMNWDEGGHHSNNFDVSVGGGPVYSSAPTTGSPIQLGSLGAYPTQSLTPSADPLLSTKMVSPVFLQQDPNFPFAGPIHHEQPVVELKKPDEFLPSTDFRKAWDVATYIDNEVLTKISSNDAEKDNNGNHDLTHDAAPSEVEVAQPQEAGRKHFHLPHAFDGPKTGNSFLDGVDAFNRGVETARDGVVDAILHPLETATDIAVFTYDMGNLAADKTLGVSDADSKIRNKERKDALIALGKQFKGGDLETQIEMATTLGAGMILGGAAGGAGGAAVNASKMAVKKTAAAARAAQKSQNLVSKSLPEPALLDAGAKAAKQNKISNPSSKLNTTLPKATHNYPLRSMAAATGAGVLKSKLPTSGTAKLANKTAPALSQKPTRVLNTASSKNSLTHQAPKPILSQYSAKGKGLAKTVAHNTANGVKELKSVSKTTAVGAKGVSSAPNLGATLGATLTKDVSAVSKTGTKALKKSLKPASYTPGFEGIKKVVKTCNPSLERQHQHVFTVSCKELIRAHSISGKGSVRLVKSLAENMKKSGYDMDKPIKVVFYQNKYYIVNGHHRYKAAQMAGIKEIPIQIVKDLKNSSVNWNTIEEVVNDALICGPDSLKFKY